MLRIQKEHIILAMQARNKEEALYELAENLVQGTHTEKSLHSLSESQRVVYAALAEREQLGSTAQGGGFALPHGKVSCLQHLVISVGRSEKGIYFDALDNKPVHLFACFLAPQKMTLGYLHTLAQLKVLFNSSEICDKLRRAQNKEAFISLFSTAAFPRNTRKQEP